MNHDWAEAKLLLIGARVDLFAPSRYEGKEANFCWRCVTHGLTASIADSRFEWESRTRFEDWSSFAVQSATIVMYPWLLYPPSNLRVAPENVATWSGKTSWSIQGEGSACAKTLFRKLVKRWIRIAKSLERVCGSVTKRYLEFILFLNLQFSLCIATVYYLLISKYSGVHRNVLFSSWK